MRASLVTLVSVLALAVWLITYDVWQVLAHGWQATISWETFCAAQSQSTVPMFVGLTFGVVLAHLFCSPLVGSVCWRVHQYALAAPALPLLSSLAVGLLLGRLYWPQR
jgi:hypothetical protein